MHFPSDYVAHKTGQWGASADNRKEPSWKFLFDKLADPYIPKSFKNTSFVFDLFSILSWDNKYCVFRINKTTYIKYLRILIVYV